MGNSAVFRIALVVLCVSVFETVLAATAGSARALVIDSGDGTGNRSAPADDPGWAHVGRREGLSAVYLENGWVLTASHVGAGEVELAGVAYRAVPGSEIHLANADSAERPDLLLFRIEEPPDLPGLRIRASTPPTGSSVILIGGGYGRGEPVRWNEVSGFARSPRSAKRWGANRIFEIDTEVSQAQMRTRCFSTQFDEEGTEQEAQAALGDSGGAVFLRGGDGWELAGVMIAVGRFPGQPRQTALYGNITNAADLSVYRDQILRAIRAGPSGE